MATDSARGGVHEPLMTGAGLLAIEAAQRFRTVYEGASFNTGGGIMLGPQQISVMAAAAVMLMLAACTPAPKAPVSDYGVDRAQIENLQARYLFAMDFRDAKSYAATFTEDGVLDFGAGKLQGREPIEAMVTRMREMDTEKPGEGAPKGRHSITSMVINVDGDKATASAYWFLMVNDNPERKARVDSFGHYEDELVKVNGEWLFKLRKIYNEGMPAWSWTLDGNPAVTPGAGPGRGATAVAP